MTRRKGEHPKFIKTDPIAHAKIMRLTNLTKIELGENKIGTTEITRRMANCKSWDMMEKEILEDAKLKKIVRSVKY